MSNIKEKQDIYSLLPASSESLLSSKGKDFVERIGIDVLHEVVYNVLCGRNLRDSTEMITRRRIGMLNAATFIMFLKGMSREKNFAKRLPELAADELKSSKKKEVRWVNEWLLGLTDKAFQNVLRDKATEIDRYAKKYAKEIEEIVAYCDKEHGEIKGIVEFRNGQKVEIDWSFIVQLLGTVGAQTLAIRGSEKSTYGKLFERLILGSMLTMLGFKLIQRDNISTFNRVFWLSERQEKRESDATALITAGRGVRFDIGFIGRGNPEISLDKVSRFEREIELGRQRFYMATFILVDRVGEGSRIVELAKRVDGTIVQMSMSFWPKLVAITLRDKLGYDSELASIPDDQVEDYLKNGLAKIDLLEFVGGKGRNNNVSKLEDFG